MSQEFARLPLTACQPNPELLRSVDRDSEEYSEFAASVKVKGVLQPILVRPIPETKRTAGGPEYFIIEGLQRWSSSKDAGFADIPARIVNMSDEEVTDAQIIANAVKIETKHKEYAQALQRILDHNPMMTLSELAARLGKSESWLQQRLSLNRLDDDVGELVDTNKITLQNAIILAKLTPEDQKNFSNDAMTKDAGTFGAAVQTHLKEKRAAMREGRPEGPVVFVPQPSFVKMAELTDLMKDDNSVSVFLKEQGIKSNADTILAAKTAFQRCAKVDPINYKARVEQYEQDKKTREANAAVKKEEKEKAKLLEATETRKKLEQELSGVK